MKVLVCGGRTFRNMTHVCAVLDAVHESTPITEVLQGGADGADRCALMWAFQRAVDCTTFEADWEAHGKAAGPIRNQYMLERGKPDLVIAFDGGKGTEDMVTRALKAGVKVRRA